MKPSLKKRVNLCFGKNDLRCIAGSELDEEIAYRTGKAFVHFLNSPKKILVGHDMRTSSHKLRDAFIRGINDYGADVLDLGEIDSPGLYFASGFLKLPGGMITASHNPGKYNGIKLVRPRAQPIGWTSGLKKIKEIVENNKFKTISRQGSLTKKNIFPDYKKHVLSFINSSNLKNLKIAIDAGNGMAGKVIPIIYKDLPIKVIPLDFKLDGNFPTHDANPIKPKNIKHLQAKVKKSKADFGIAFDADMDRVAFVDEHGSTIDSSIIAALLIKHFCFLRKERAIVHNIAMSKIVPETAKKFKAKPYREKVGHAFIKTKMRSVNAIFGCEHSAHYYYKKNYFADSGLITSLLVAEIYCEAKQPFSTLIKEFQKYAKLPEKSVKVKDKEKILKIIERKYSRKGKVEKLDGLTIDFADWWFNIRPSNTEPLLRVNVEADSQKILKNKTRELLSLIKLHH